MSSASQTPRVAVLYQELEPPTVDGSKKPKKPGGYQDSGADIAYALRQHNAVQVITSATQPDPSNHAGWTFPDTEQGILEAVRRGATHLWANTILFASHPLQSSAALDAHQDEIRVVGQGPLAVQRYDDKDYGNALLRKSGPFTMPRTWPSSELTDVVFPVVAKPCRGRGSFGVKVCHTAEELTAHAQFLQEGSMAVMVEEYLAGEEATVTVMPPGPGINGKYWALPVVSRFNHEGGIAPYNGAVAVTANSRVPDDESADGTYAEVKRECEAVAERLGTSAPIRIDVRRLKGAAGSRFAIFDVNMKPNMTGPGRPGREDQASLTLMAAAALGWDYHELLVQILATSQTLRSLRNVEPV